MKRLSTISLCSILLLGALGFANDWQAPTDPSRYDWRNTTWFGLSGGTITGPGLSMQHWGESQGYRITCLPAFTFDTYSPNRMLFLGGAYMHSLNHPKAVVANHGGFTSTHFFWYAGGFGVAGVDGKQSLLGGSVSGGLGMDLNRRDARWSLLLGLGPYYMKEGSEMLLRIYPSFELSWHFGAPRRITP